MALKFIIQFPIFAPQINPTAPPPHRLPTEIRFSRWNNANAEPFNQRRRAQQQIEDDLRRGRRFDSADRIATTIHDSGGTSTTTTTTTKTSVIETFKSTGTPSSPSRPSIPGKKSKYSKDESSNNRNTHPAFRRADRARRNNQNRNILEQRGKSVIGVSEDGVSFKVEGAPFEMMYSYTETPKVKPLALRERLFSPFGPETMARPWTGKAPLPGSKKRLKEFDSFVLPPPDKKGIKPVQKPGPFLPGSGPKYVKSREEILGDPLTEEEVKDLIKSSMKSDRQLNMGRDGLTHNMLDNIHAHWKRRRVCKIKCKGVCTVDMLNVREQLEDKTGGKIIYSKGGVLFLFRGRNYNYRTRPRYPIMLWKPATPVYPRLIKRAPEGLTLEEAGIMRTKGRKLIPICKLAKNGLYADLANNVREAFEECELVRINCQGLNPSDYRKIGAKLKDLVPCVLVSFEHEHILMWRGREWKSSLPEEEDNGKESQQTNSNNVASIVSASAGQEVSETRIPQIADDTTFNEALTTNILQKRSEDVVEEQRKPLRTESIDQPITTPDLVPNIMEISNDKSETMWSSHDTETIKETEIINDSEPTINFHESETILETTDDETEAMSNSHASETVEEPVLSTELVRKDHVTDDKLGEIPDTSEGSSEANDSTTPCTEGVLLLLKQALEQGSAIILDDSPLDDDAVYKRVVAFSQSAPPGPVFKYRPKRVVVQKWDKEQTGESKVNKSIEASEKRVEFQKYDKKRETVDIKVKEIKNVAVKSTRAKKNSRPHKMNEFNVDYPNGSPRGSLGVDELAKLLS